MYDLDYNTTAKLLSYGAQILQTVIMHSLTRALLRACCMGSK